MRIEGEVRAFADFFNHGLIHGRVGEHKHGKREWEGRTSGVCAASAGSREKRSKAVVRCWKAWGAHESVGQWMTSVPRIT